jgi:hypothetical protein
MPQGFSAGKSWGRDEWNPAAIAFAMTRASRDGAARAWRGAPERREDFRIIDSTDLTDWILQLHPTAEHGV